MNSPILNVNNLSVSYMVRSGIVHRIRKQAVKNVSLQIGEGEICGLIGESGCGKTTLAKAICGLIPYCGTVLLCGKPAETMHRLERGRQLQLIFQNPDSALNPCMTAAQILEEPLVIHKVGSKAERLRKVSEMLYTIGLTDEYAHRRMRDLSGGQRQRIAIGCALLASPRLIICDEILSSLDVSIQANILNLLSRMNSERGVSFLFISHDINTVCYFCHRIGVMYQGELIETGTADDIYYHPRHEYTSRLVAAAPRLPM